MFLINGIFCYFVLFLIPSLIHFITNRDSSNDVTILIIFSISSFEIITAAVPDPWIFFWIGTSSADIPSDNPDGVKTLLANVVSTLSLIVNQLSLMI